VRERSPQTTWIARARAARLALALVFAAALVLVGSAEPIGTLGLAQARAASLELVPAYFGPEGLPDPWHTMCEAAPAGSTMILNPDNGPVKKDAQVYAEPMRFCEEHRQRVIGYVYTKYGKRPLATVEKAIAHYYSWYPTVQGIFLDEMAEVPTAKIETYYTRLASYVHEKGGFVVGNPGDTAATAWQLGAVDEVVTFEGSAAAYAGYSPAAWVLAARSQQIANIIFAASEPSQMEADCVKGVEENAGSIYVTNLPEKPNPYETLPSYWTTETARC
jgi:hypothetical protein